MDGQKTTRASYSLEPEYQDLFRAISELTRRSMTDELRLMIDARAQILGLTPVSDVDAKKFWASILEPA